jgi:hypothetical protein
MKISVKTLKSVRLDGKDIPAGRKVEIDNDLLSIWKKLGLAEEVKPENPPQKDGEKDESKTEDDNSTGSGAPDTGGGKAVSEN